MTAVTAGVRETSVAPAAGDVDVAVGGASVPEATVNVHEYGVPSVAWSVAETVPLSRAVYVAPAVSAAVGANVAVNDGLSYVTVPPIAPDGPVTVNVDGVKVVGSMSFENVALTVIAGVASVAPAVGTVRTTVGRTGSSVVKLHWDVAPRGMPSRARTAVVTF